MKLSDFADSERVVGIFIEHQKVDSNISEGASDLKGCHASFSESYEPTAAEEINLGIDASDLHEEPLRNMTMDEIEDVVLDNNDSGEDDEASIGDDSEYSEELVDSDWEQTDDVGFMNNIDFEVEWVGLDSQSVEREMKGKNAMRVYEKIDQENTKATYNGYKVFNPKLDMDDPKFEVELCFTDTDILRAAIRQHSRVHGRDIKFTKNDRFKVQAKCKTETCPWKLYASKLPNDDTMMIKTLHGVHKCYRKHKVIAANSTWLANKYHDRIKTDPDWKKFLENLKEKSNDFIVHWNGDAEFEAEDSYGDRLNVNLKMRTCSCRRWQLNGIPCAHAIAAIFYMGEEPEAYVDECYHKETYLRIYSHLMTTLDGSDSWLNSEMPPLLPPEHEKLPGRPKKNNRRKQPDEIDLGGKKVVDTAKGKSIANIGKIGRKGIVMTCSVCKQKKHNLRTCPSLKHSKTDEPSLDIPASCRDHTEKKKKKGTQQSVTEPVSERTVELTTIAVNESEPTAHARKKLKVRRNWMASQSSVASCYPK
ncbi:hypothetical protein CRG98_045435 [Punica granatum]|uniref:SWIM-type domain-containing protein n=1 Tax=Punica granatum TaxID=22663 RepID=A0A2I0HSC3_PUNGR|nr:hypothetical protein CRG98_045435 [Punica granatum]